MNLAEDTLRYNNGSDLGVSATVSHAITNVETHPKPLAFSGDSPLAETPTLKINTTGRQRLSIVRARVKKAPDNT